MIKRMVSGIMFMIIASGASFALFSGQAAAPASQAAAPAAPDEYARLYKYLEAQIGLVERHFAASPTSAPPRAAGPVFTAELLAANGNRGEDLLVPRVLQAAALAIQRTKEMGFGGIWMSLIFPIFDPGTPRRDEFVAFYRKVVAAARAQGLAVCVDMGTMFENPLFSRMHPDYKSLTLATFAAAMHEMAAVILRELKPDYLGILDEPDTQSTNTGLDLTPANLVAFARTVLAGLDKGSTKIGIGAGTWIAPTYFEAIARDIPVDVIDLHIYPISREFATTRLDTAARLAAENGKGLVIGESWLYKAGEGELGRGIASTPEIFKRDVYDFWAPLDARFIAAVMALARTRGVAYCNFFWSRSFFADVPYGPDTRTLSPEQAFARLTQNAGPNMVAGRYSPLGDAVRKLLGR
jgi:hypothetical protein